MKYLHIMIAVGFTVSLLLAPARSGADVNWFWSFDQTAYVVNPADTIIVHATLSNDPSSTQNLRNVEGVSAIFSGDLQKTYDFTFGPTGNSSEFSLQFFGLDIAPGQNAPFVYGILTPIGGVAPEGFYLADPATVGLDLPGADLEQKFSTNTFSITVNDNVCPHPIIPEPSGFILFSTGIIGLVSGAWLRRYWWSG